MAGPLFFDRVQENSTTTGTGTYTLSGATTGFQAWSVVGNANTAYYMATDGTGWEVGLGTYTLSGTTLARTTILSSSNSNAAVSWSAGTKTVSIVDPAAYLSAIPNSNLAAMAANTVKANLTGSSAVPTDATTASLLTALESVGGYGKTNIVGTVSQSGGVPTGGVVEQGSNASGNYVRLADGTQICWFRFTVNSAVSTAYGSIFVSSSVTGTAYIKAFTAVPAVFGSVDNPPAGARWMGFFNNATTTTWPSQLVYDAVSRTAADININLMAIGRWF